MEPTIIENLEAVTAANAKLTEDLAAANALLTEAQAKATADAETIRALTEQAGALADAANDAAAQIAAKDAELADKTAALADIAAQLKDATDKLALAPFKDAASAGIDPVKTSVETTEGQDLWAAYNAITNPRARAEFWAKHGNALKELARKTK